MTLCISWIRRLPQAEELYMVTDSRLRFGCSWDSCPKIVEFNRGDVVMCFAGDTQYAYPMMDQVAKSINQYPGSNSRATDITDVKGHTLRLLTRMRRFITDLPVGQKLPDLPDVTFLLAGYSWRYAKFYIWEIHFDKRTNGFVARTQQTLQGNKIAIIGDLKKESKRAIEIAFMGKGKKKGDHFDMEPFEILRDTIRDQKDPAIGGPIQIIKVTRRMATMPYAVFWPDKESGQISLFGRPLLDYETTPYFILDPDTMDTHEMKIPNPEIPRIQDSGQV